MIGLNESSDEDVTRDFILSLKKSLLTYFLHYFFRCQMTPFKRFRLMDIFFVIFKLKQLEIIFNTFKTYFYTY